MKATNRMLMVIVAIALVGGCSANAAHYPSGQGHGGSNMQPSTTGVTNAQPSCIAAGQWCRWDSQCCSGRCYVDTGCGG